MHYVDRIIVEETGQHDTGTIREITDVMWSMLRDFGGQDLETLRRAARDAWGEVIEMRRVIADGQRECMCAGCDRDWPMHELGQPADRRSRAIEAVTETEPA